MASRLLRPEERIDRVRRRHDMQELGHARENLIRRDECGGLVRQSRRREDCIEGAEPRVALEELEPGGAAGSRPGTPGSAPRASTNSMPSEDAEAPPA
jgi:hypothetical protein